jgi:phage tail sheath protein FI
LEGASARGRQRHNGPDGRAYGRRRCHGQCRFAQRHSQPAGFRVWGARTLSSDPEWKYVNVRRLALFIERSISEGLQWAAFEPNTETLWNIVRTSVEVFMRRLFQQGAFEATREDDAYFVRCDRTTMTQDDIDNGRLIVVIGFAPARPAEFVVVRVG